MDVRFGPKQVRQEARALHAQAKEGYGRVEQLRDQALNRTDSIAHFILKRMGLHDSRSQGKASHQLPPPAEHVLPSEDEINKLVKEFRKEPVARTDFQKKEQQLELVRKAKEGKILAEMVKEETKTLFTKELTDLNKEIVALRGEKFNKINALKIPKNLHGSHTELAPINTRLELLYQKRAYLSLIESNVNIMLKLPTDRVNPDLNKEISKQKELLEQKYHEIDKKLEALNQPVKPEFKALKDLSPRNSFLGETELPTTLYNTDIEVVKEGDTGKLENYRDELVKILTNFKPEKTSPNSNQFKIMVTSDIKKLDQLLEGSNKLPSPLVNLEGDFLDIMNRQEALEAHLKELPEVILPSQEHMNKLHEILSQSTKDPEKLEILEGTIEIMKIRSQVSEIVNARREEITAAIGVYNKKTDELFELGL